MKRLKIVCILMAILLLAGCTAPPGTTETLSREEQETGQIALMGQPVESEPSPQPSKESSQKHFEDTVSVEETPYQWDFQKRWKVFGGYFDLPEHIVSTGIFGLLGLPYTEWLGKANNDAKQQGEKVLFHVFFRAEMDVTAFGVPAEPVTFTVVFDDVEREYTGYHADLSLADMVQLSTLAGGLHFDFCDCDREYDESHTVKLWWNTPDVDWDFQKGWPLYVLSEEDWETLTHQCYPDMVMPIGSPMFWKAVNDFPAEELLFEVCIGSVALSGDPEQFFRSLGIPYKILEHDLYPQQIYLLNLSVSDCFQVVKLMHQAGLVWAEDAMIFEIYRHGEPLLDVETVYDVPKNEIPVLENLSYNWDFQKGWPIYVGECVDTFEDRCWPYGDGEWYNTTSALSAAGEKLLYHIRPLISHCDEYTSKLCSLLDSLEIPYETTVTEFGNKGIHFNLSRRDSVQLAGYMLENGLTDDCLNLFTFCNCGDLCGATNTASPKIPDDWETLAWKYED